MSTSVPVPARWNYWKRALTGDYTGWDSSDAPFPGYWRIRYSRRDIWRPVAIWDVRKNRQLTTLCLVGKSEPGKVGFHMDPESPVIIWADQRAWANPVTHKQYEHARKHGNWWDSLKPSEAFAAAKGARIATNVADAAAIVPTRKGNK